MKQNPTPKDLIEYRKIIDSLYKVGDYEEALEYLKYYDKNNLDNSHYKDITYLYGKFYDELNQYDLAIKYYEKCLNFNQHYTIYGNLGRLYSNLYHLGERDKQEYYINKAYELNPNDKINIINMFLLHTRFYMDDVPYWYDKINNVCPNVDFDCTYARWLIHNKQYKEGFELHKNRLQCYGQIYPEGLRNIWNGEDIKDKVVLLSYEQGYGDTFLFLRFISDLIPLCKELKVMVQDEVYPLVQEFIDCKVYPECKLSEIEYDTCLLIFDIPRLIDLDPDNIPYKNGWMKLKENLDERFKIGISYEGSYSSIPTCRDIPLRELYPLLDLDADVYCLQKEDSTNQLKDSPDKLIKVGNTFTTWRETADFIKDLDLIITTDNGILNLAGSMGKKTFGLFNTYPEWRWNLGKDIGWYNIKPYQCKEFGNWKPVIQNVVEDTKQLIDKKYNKKI